MVWVDLNSRNVRVQNATANNRLLTVAPLRTIAESARQSGDGVMAAINGTFFDPVATGYSGSNVYWGIIKNNGVYVKTGGSDLVMGFSPDNRVRVGTPQLTIRLHREGSRTLNAWSINHSFGGEEAVVVYTSAFGTVTPYHVAVSIVVRNGVVTEVRNGYGPIFADGFTITVNSHMPAFNFSVGDRVTLNVEYADAAWREYTTMLAGGSRLVENGNIPSVFPPHSDTFVNSSAQRSFIGVTADNRLVMGTVGGVTITQLAEIVRNLGAVDAMTLDGGASSGLYFNGRYITSTGRPLVTALIFAETIASARPAITVTINGEPISFDVQPQIINDSVMVPMRVIFEEMGATVLWDAQTRTATAEKGETTVVLQAGSLISTINGAHRQLIQPGIVINGATLVPLRFVAEAFGGSVEWDSASNTAVISW